MDSERKIVKGDTEKDNVMVSDKWLTNNGEWLTDYWLTDRRLTNERLTEKIDLTGLRINKIK